MKAIFFSISFLFFAGTAFAQSPGKAKLYGFKEAVIGGMSPGKPMEEGGTQSSGEGKPAYNYFIYLVNPSRVYPSEMWIDGKAYSVGIETIRETPVVRENANNAGDPDKTELVPRTNETVLYLKPAPAIESKLSQKGRSLSTTNELVVIYKMNGKFYYQTMTSLASLEPAIKQ